MSTGSCQPLTHATKRSKGCCKYDPMPTPVPPEKFCYQLRQQPIDGSPVTGIEVTNLIAKYAKAIGEQASISARP